ncbi:Uncharacterised protein [Yersinia aleksiciae]|uniref:Lipoprotein n=1 Tax=Yersinia aleksiciae TaxID=263819 RepID=A0A0T9T863_YERAE|nr:Uncharacterised protein [Yersinia aleksiciae]CNK67445.1 Uncharacterised protein [Yersinia aleksiciae]
MKYRMLILFALLPLCAPTFACMHQGPSCYVHCREAYPKNLFLQFLCDLGGKAPAPHSATNQVVYNFTKTEPALQATNLLSI